MNPWASRRYPDYKGCEDEMIGSLPAEWETKQVRRILKDGRDGIRIGPFGSALKLEDLAEDGICVYGQENVIGRSFSLGKRYITDERFSELEAYEARAGDLLITMMGTSGKCTIVPSDARKGIIDSHLLRLRVRPEAVLPEYFRLLIDECHEIAAQISVAGKGSIMLGLNSAIVKSLMLPLPSTAEQGTILKFLDYETAKIDALIEKQQQLIALLKEKRQAVISHAVTKGLNPDAPMRDSGVEWLGEVPAHWAILKGAWLGELFGSEAVPDEHVVDEGPVAFIKVSSLSREGFELSEKNFFVSEARFRSIRLRRGFVVFPKRGAAIFTNKVNIIREDAVIDPNLMGWKLNERAIPEYMAHLLKLRGLSDIADVSTVPQINNKHISPMMFPVPPLEEQRSILSELDTKTAQLDLLGDGVECAVALLQERRTALISAAVTGKIDVRDWRQPDA